MKLQRSHGGALALALTLLSVPALLEAQIGCALPKPEGASNCNASPGCQPGCGGAKAVSNGAWSPCVGGGGIDMSMTRFKNECCACNGVCTQAAKVPPLRLWGYDQFKTANSGCESYLSTAYLANGGLDLPPGNPPGVWFMYQGQWAGTLKNDGCISVTRNVAEVSFTEPDDAKATPAVTSVNHNAWYVIMSATAGTSGGPWDFDSIRGGTGCPTANVAVPVMERVPAVTIQGRTLGCTGTTTATAATANATAGFFDVDVNITPSAPSWYDEVGKNTAANSLIAGIQVMYMKGTEPGSSEIGLGGWKPTLNPTNRMGNAFFPLPITNPVKVTIPLSGAEIAWFAARVIYRDATVSAPGDFDPAVANSGPQLGSPVGSHCGPVSGTAPPTLAVYFDKLGGLRTPEGVRIDFTTFLEEGTNGFIIERAVNSRATDAFTKEVGTVAAKGTGSSYKLIDTEAKDATATYYYRIQEMTDNGLGTMSDVFSVGPAGRSGSRSRGGSTVRSH